MIVQVKKDTPTTDSNEPDNQKRFEGEGVVFKAKLIGSELVLEPRGDKMCQNSIQRLKAIIKGTNGHKRRVVLKISLDGVKVYDEKTNEILHHHEVSQISFIASDDSDTRTFGYVGDVANKAHQFICFKTSGPAANVISDINSLFEAVVEKKKQKEKEQQEEKDKKIISDEDIFGPPISTRTSNLNITTPNNNNINNNNNTSDIKTGTSAPLSSLQEAFATTTSSAISITNNALLKTTSSIDILTSNIATTPASSTSISKNYSVDLIDDSGIMNMPWPSTPISVASSNPTPNRSLIYNHSSVSLSDAALTRQSSFSSSVKNDSYGDRYAAFNDIDNLPSIFESASLNNVNKISVNKNPFDDDFFA